MKRSCCFVFFMMIGLSSTLGCSRQDEQAEKEKPQVVQDMNIVKPGDEARSGETSEIPD